MVYGECAIINTISHTKLDDTFILLITNYYNEFFILQIFNLR